MTRLENPAECVHTCVMCAPAPITSLLCCCFCFFKIFQWPLSSIFKPLSTRQASAPQPALSLPQMVHSLQMSWFGCCQRTWPFARANLMPGPGPRAWGQHRRWRGANIEDGTLFPFLSLKSSWAHCSWSLCGSHFSLPLPEDTFTDELCSAWPDRSHALTPVKLSLTTTPWMQSFSLLQTGLRGRSCSSLCHLQDAERARELQPLVLDLRGKRLCLLRSL